MSDLELNLELQLLTILSADLAEKKKKKIKNYVVIVRLTIYRSELVTHDII